MRAVCKTLFCALALFGSDSVLRAQNPPLVPPPSVRDESGPTTSRYFSSSGVADQGADDDFWLRLHRDSGPFIMGGPIGGVGHAAFDYGGFSPPYGALADVVPTTAILPGLLTSTNVESPYPMDRVFFYYSYYDRFQIVNTIAVDTSLNQPAINVKRPLFNLNRFDIGAEKTVFGGLASVYVRAPFLEANNNIYDSPVNGVGNLSAGLKSILLVNEKTGDVLSVGLTVAAPTARPGYFTKSPTERNELAPTPELVKVNPTFFQPWVAAQFNYGRLYTQYFLGVVVPSTREVATTFNPNLSVGYRIYEGNGWIKSITPYLDAQVLAPFHMLPLVVDGSRPSSDGAHVRFATQLLLTQGLNFVVGERTAIFCGVTEPVAGPKAFDVGAQCGINYFY